MRYGDFCRERYTSASAMRRPDLLDLNDALQHPGREVAVDIETELESEPDLDLAAPFCGSLTAVSSGNLLILTGHFEGKLILECARCGEPVEHGVEFEVNEQFPVEGTPSAWDPKGFAKVVPDEPYEMFEGNSLLVDSLLREEVILEIPQQALCPFGWDGPCPHAKDRGPGSAKAAGRSEFSALEKLRKPEDDAS